MKNSGLEDTFLELQTVDFVSWSVAFIKLHSFVLCVDGQAHCRRRCCAGNELFDVTRVQQ